MKEPIQYHSPLHFLLFFNNDLESIDISSIQVLKKQALLELQFSENQFLEINGFPYSKQLILKTFDELNEESLKFHLYIWKHDELLTFLETFEITKKLSLTYFSKDYKIEKSINDKLELYLVYAFIEASKQFLKQNKFTALTLGLNYINQLDDNLRQLAIKRIEHYYNRIALMLASTNNRKYLFKREEHFFLSQEYFYNLLNQLPAEYQNLRDSIGDNMVNHLYYYHKQHREFYNNVSVNCLRINCSTETKKLLVNNYNAVYKTPIKKYLILLLIPAIISVLSSIFGNNAKNENEFPKVDLKDYQKEIMIVSYLHQHEKKDTTSVFEFSDARGLNAFINDASSKKNIYINNNTNYDAILVYYNHKFGFFQGHLLANSSTQYKLNMENAKYFFYLGKNWLNNDSIVYSVQNNEKHERKEAGMNGYFSIVDRNTNYLLDTVFEINRTKKMEDSIYSISIDYNQSDSSIIVNTHF